MILFETNARRAVINGIAAIVALVLGIGVVVALAVILPRTIITFFLITLVVAMLIAIIWLGYHTYALAHTSYALDRNSFVIRWGPIREIIPMGDVQRVIAAADLGPNLKLLRVPLPNWWIGSGRHPELGKINFYSNAPLSRQVIIVTPDLSYAISPYDVEGFLEAFRVRFEMGPTQAVRPARLTPRFMGWPIWQDRVAQWLVLIAIALNAVLFAATFARYPALPNQIVLHFDALGAPDRFGGRPLVFAPPIIALQLFVVNFFIALGVYVRGERLAAYLAWGGSAIIQLLFLVATITIAFAM
jgi:hypothetical protein